MRARFVGWMVSCAAAIAILVSGATLQQAGAGFSDEMTTPFTITIEGSASPEEELTPETVESQSPDATIAPTDETTTVDSGEPSQQEQAEVAPPSEDIPNDDEYESTSEVSDLTSETETEEAPSLTTETTISQEVTADEEVAVS